MALPGQVERAIRRALPWLYAFGLLWLNAYLCRELFRIEHSGRMYSLQGLWMAMARLHEGSWLADAWWPYWYGGMPFEFTYAPLVPRLMRFCMDVAGVSPARAFHLVLGAVYCLLPVCVYVAAWALTRKPGASFLAAAVYSLCSPTELLLPDGNFSLVHFRDPRRLYLASVWDELPHLAALALSLLAVAALWKAWTARRWPWYLLTVAAMSAAVMASAFGATLLALFSVCLLVVCPPRQWPRAAAVLAATAIAAYAAISPLMTPALIRVIARNTSEWEDSAWTASSWMALGAVLCGVALIVWCTRRSENRPLRFFAVLAFVCTAIPAMDAWKHAHFVPQPGRYKVEMELALALLAVFAVEALARAARWRVVVVVLLVAACIPQAVAFRRWAKQSLKPVDVTTTAEYRFAKWAEANLPEGRVMAPGSLGQWMNVFNSLVQFSGGSYPTALNMEQQRAIYAIHSCPDAGAREGAVAVSWMKAFGVESIAVPGPKSGEAWKPFRNPNVFDGVLPLIAEVDGVRVYRVGAGTARVAPESALPKRAPRNCADVGELDAFLAASRPAETEWDAKGGVRIRAMLAPGEVVAVPVNYHARWQAPAMSITENALGQMVLRPAQPGAVDVELAYGNRAPRTPR